MSHNHQKKIALINDMSGFGRCSIAVALPIISVMKVQCCPMPTSIFSNHTGFPEFFMEDFTEQMIPYAQNWKKLGLEFNGICTGFLGSAKQIQTVRNFIQDFRTNDTIVIVDPVMGDHGKAYSTYTPEMCQRMKELVQYATILTPNITEACLLTDTPYKTTWKTSEIVVMAETLVSKGPSKVVITGIPQKSYIANLCFETGRNPTILKVHRIGTERSGTGDIFASIIAADAINGIDFLTSVRKASKFIKKCILRSIELDIPLTDGVCFEEVLHTLH